MNGFHTGSHLPSYIPGKDPRKAPYLACKTLETLSKQSTGRFPEAAKLLALRIYLDDLSTSLSDVNLAKQIVIDSVEMLHGANFLLRKWANGPEVMFFTPMSERELVDT